MSWRGAVPSGWDDRRRARGLGTAGFEQRNANGREFISAPRGGGHATEIRSKSAARKIEKSGRRVLGEMELSRNGFRRRPSKRLRNLAQARGGSRR